jgi:hypothetical protein
MEGGVMRDEEIDRALSAESDILPSSGFSRSVMNAVTREAEAPRPIPFPWKRLAPAVVAGVAGLAALAWAAWRAPANPQVATGSSTELAEFLGRIAHAAASVELPWLLGVAALTLMCALVGPRLVGRKQA